jgi:DNA invertase Pin-like site-specific DNA recombinase
MVKTKKNETTSTPTAVIYLRVSTDQQARDGIGLDAQFARCEALAAARGLSVAGVFRDEGVSGKAELRLRPGLQAAIAECKKTGAVLLSYSVSRIARRQRLLWDLLDPEGGHRLAYISATEPFDTSTPMGRAMLGMIGVWSQLEADLVSERTKDALAQAKARGTRLGAPSTSTLVTESAVERIDTLSAAGFSLRQIADKLNVEGVPTAKGVGQWWPKTVRSVLLDLQVRRVATLPRHSEDETP